MAHLVCVIEPRKVSLLTVSSQLITTQPPLNGNVCFTKDPCNEEVVMRCSIYILNKVRLAGFKRNKNTLLM